MKTNIKWLNNMAIQATTQSGHTINLDGPPELGGANTGARPMEMLLVGMGACTTVDVISILQKMHQNVSNCEIEITSKRAKEHPKIFTDIHLHFILSGDNLDPKKIAKAIKLSATKYCSASIMLSKSANISHNWSIK